MQQPQPASGPAAQPQQSQQPQQFQQPASHTQQWAPVIEAHDLVMDYTASMARAQAGHGVTGVMPAGTGAGYASANPAAAGPGAIQAGQPSQPAQPGFAMPTMHTLALNHVNFTLREGETVAVMGPSGSGKSTLLHALAGIIKPTAGTVIFRGADLSRMSDAERTKLRRNDFGFVFQSGQLLPELPAVENIALPMMLDGMPYRTATDTAILWLERMGLRALATHRPGEMSGGQMQRIAIARALAVKPAVVFADEPTGALDQATGREVMGILMAAARDNGSAVVVVTHDPNVASFCGRTVMMQDGRLHQTDANPNSAPAGGGSREAGGGGPIASIPRLVFVVIAAIVGIRMDDRAFQIPRLAGKIRVVPLDRAGKHDAELDRQQTHDHDQHDDRAVEHHLGREIQHLPLHSPAHEHGEHASDPVSYTHLTLPTNSLV